jgi:hypothetical protein
VSMEITCNRCHQFVPADSCYCPACGLPQLVYSADGDSGGVPAASERWPEPVRDASSIDWKPGMRAALALAVPAGLLSSGISPLSALGIFWMAGAAAGAVMLYMRSQRPAWITMGAGARIGLVTGLIAGWVTFGASGIWLFVQRVILHQAGQIDAVYTAFLDAFKQKANESMASMSAADAAQLQTTFSQIQAWLTSPEGHAGVWAFSIAFNCAFLVLFAVGGGALGARMQARKRRPEV